MTEKRGGNNWVLQKSLLLVKNIFCCLELLENFESIILIYKNLKKTFIRANQSALHDVVTKANFYVKSVNNVGHLLNCFQGSNSGATFSQKVCRKEWSLLMGSSRVTKQERMATTRVVGNKSMDCFKIFANEKKEINKRRIHQQQNPG